MIDTDFLKHLNRLSIIINKRVTSNFTGQRESIRTGQGTLFKDHGIYTPGDDFRRIDWKVYARTDKLHIKRYEEDKNLTTHIILDSSASMDYSSGSLKKFEYAAMIGLGLAYMSMKKNEKFVISTFSDKLEVFKPKKGMRQMVSALDYLKNRNAEGESKFESSLKDYSKLIKNRSSIFIVSDFLYDPESITNVILKFKNHKVKLIQVLDDMEVKLDLKGEFKLKDVETKGVLKTFIGPFLRKHYLQKLEEHVKKLRWIANSLGVDFYSFTTGTNIYDSFYKILQD